MRISANPETARANPEAVNPRPLAPTRASPLETYSKPTRASPLETRSEPQGDLPGGQRVAAAVYVLHYKPPIIIYIQDLCGNPF